MNLLSVIETISNHEIIEPANIGLRKLTPKKILSKIHDQELKKFLIELFDKTIYMNWYDVIRNLTISIDKFLSEINGNFYISLNKAKFSSELLFLCIFWKKIKNRVIDIIEIDKNLPKNIIVLSIDDFVLTGSSLLATIDEFKYNTGREDISFYVCVAGSTLNGKNTLTDFGVKVYSNYNIPILMIPEKFQNEITLGKTDATVALYTDHKISNSIFNTPYLYHYGILSNYEVGCLITYPPDENIKYKIWEKYFTDSISPPKIYNYK